MTFLMEIKERFHYYDCVTEFCVDILLYKTYFPQLTNQQNRQTKHKSVTQVLLNFLEYYNMIQKIN